MLAAGRGKEGREGGGEIAQKSRQFRGCESSPVAGRLITLRASPTRKFHAEASLMTLNSINAAAIRTFREFNARIHDSSPHAARHGR
jgi:hypothetical protein